MLPCLIFFYIMLIPPPRPLLSFLRGKVDGEDEIGTLKLSMFRADANVLV